MLRKNTIKFYSILFLLYLSTLSTLSQTITIVGDVQDGFLQKTLPEAKISLLNADSIVIVDSLPKLQMGSATRYGAEVPPVKSSYWVRATLNGYRETWQKVDITNLTKKEVKVPTIDMRKERIINLDDVVVQATRVKMFYRGDTLIYDASAFKLPEGSMLDALIAQLPGVEMNDKGEIFVNGRKVDELLLGSRSFMRGNSKVLMENLPYYTVSNLKVYEKASDESIALGHDVGSKRYVMDVNLKKEYQIGYIANMEAAAGTEKRWLGRGFLLRFADRWRHTLLANTNNVNENRHIGQSGYWSPNHIPQNLITTHSISGEANYAAKGMRNTLFADYSHATTTIDMRQRHETFLTGMTPMSQNEMSKCSKDYMVGVQNYFTLLKPFFFTLQTNFRRTQTNGDTQSAFRQWGDTLTATMLTSALDEQTWTNAFVSGNLVMSVNKEKRRDVGIELHYMYNNNEVERANQYDVTQNASSNVRRNSNDILNRTHEINAGSFYRQPMGKQWKVYAKAAYSLHTTKAHDFLYHPDTLTLPSQLEAMAAITDPQNSYDYQYTKNRETISLNLTNYELTPYMPGVNITSDRFIFNLDIPLLQQELDYRRGMGTIIDTLARHNTVYVNPEIKFEQKFGKNKRNEVRASASFTTHDLDLLQTISFRDDSQPLVVNLGNADLKSRQTSCVSLGYANHNGPGKQEVSTGIRFDYSHRDIAQSQSYDKATGVYTYQPINVNGGYTWNGTLNYSRELDKKRYWTVQSNATATLHHSVDHSMFSGDTESRLNKVNTYILNERAYIQYNKEALNIRATGNVKWHRSTGHMQDFSTLSAIDYQYGLSARYTIPALNTTLSADANMYSRRGYGSSSLNTDDFVLNASVSQPLLKGKVIARLEAFDLFHQLSSTQYEVNAQGRTETWYRSLPHYVMLHVVYHWNKNPKRK